MSNRVTFNKHFNYAVHKVVKVVDGDTVRVVLDHGFKLYSEVDVRIVGVDAPETRTKNLDEKEAGNRTKAYVVNWLMVHNARGRSRQLQLRCVSTDRGKYAGRMIGDLYFVMPGGEVMTSLSKNLLDSGMVREYQGGKRLEWHKEQLLEIMKVPFDPFYVADAVYNVPFNGKTEA